MRRRDFLRSVVPLTLTPQLLMAQGKGAAPPPPAPVPWTLGLNPATPLPKTVTADEVAATELRFFSQAQMATLRRLANVLMPALDGRPGALQAEVPDFLDFLVGSSPGSRKGIYTGGLDWLEGESQAQYKRTFASLSDAEAGSLLQPWMRSWMNDHPPTEPHADFVNIAHADIRNATVNSKVWSELPPSSAEETTPTGLYWQPIEPVVPRDGARCAGTPAQTIAAPRSEHSVPDYPH